MTCGDMRHFEELAAGALTSYENRPDAVGVARLIDGLITAGQALHAELSALPAGRRAERTGAALVEWTSFVDAGPLGGNGANADHANWNHARNLARIARVLAAALAVQRPSGVR
ncbi:hypothetical protein [Streptomyces sp. NPDC058613]|uniref:hypothetical protein n=1 Tax=Streptomyces sp. NPDC058613 TaxID=3346556 RepID=UPI003650134D